MTVAEPLRDDEVANGLAFGAVADVAKLAIVVTHRMTAIDCLRVAVAAP